MPKTRSLSRFAKAAVSLEVFLGVGALGGGGALMLGSRGQIIPLPLSALNGSPFETYFAPGLILFCALGLGPPCPPLFGGPPPPPPPFGGLGVGVALLIWMAVETPLGPHRNPPPLPPSPLPPGPPITGVGLGWRITHPEYARLTRAWPQ